MAENNELEKTLWAAADKLRSNMDAAEYKHVVLGLIFLKYISDAFNDLHEQLKAGEGEFEGADPEDADEYLAHNIFFVPEKARWQYLQDRAKQPEIGKWLDEAMDAIEKINPPLKGVLPKIYADPELNKQRLGELIDLIGTIGFSQSGHQAKDLLGRVYEYFLGQFADAEGKKGGQFYTPRSIVKLLVEMLEPYKGRVYDGCCGSGGMFVQSENFVEEHQGNIKDLSIYGQESNPTTLRLAKMNLAIRGIDRQNRAGRYLSERQTQGPEGRFHPRQSALQRQRLERRAPARRPPLEIRRAAGGQCQLCLAAALRPQAQPQRYRRDRAGQRQHELQLRRRGRDPQEHDRSGTDRLHGGPAGPALLQHHDPRLPLVPGPQQGQRQIP